MPGSGGEGQHPAKKFGSTFKFKGKGGVKLANIFGSIFVQFIFCLSPLTTTFQQTNKYYHTCSSTAGTADFGSAAILSQFM